MKCAIALLAALVVVGSASIIRKPLRTVLEQQWLTQYPEISRPHIQQPIFQDGNEYKYLYDGQILTGLTDTVNQYSGARIRAIVKIQLGQKDLMQIEKVFVGSLHERYVSDPQDLIELDAFEPLPEQDAPFEEVLKKPIQFIYENGKIKDFTATNEDPSWSINIKRSILSTFHLSLTDRELPEEENKRPNPQHNEVKKSKEVQEYYTVVEDGIGGRCEANYLIVQTPDEPEYQYPIYDTEAYKAGKPQIPQGQENLNVLNVTKTWDYRNCEYRPFVFKGVHLQKPCIHCESDPEQFFDFLESAAHTRYSITGNKQEYIIDSAVTEAVYKVTPGSHYAGSLISYANATYTLIYSGPIAQPIQFSDVSSVQIDGLHMVDAVFNKREGDKYLYTTPEANKPIVQNPAYWPTVANKPQKIRALCEKLVQGMQLKEINSDYTALIEEIQRLLTYANAEELQQIYDQIKTISVQGFEKEEVEHVFADLLVSAGTKCTFTFLKKLITEATLKGPVVKDVLALMPLKMDVRDVDKDVIEAVYQMCQNENVQKSIFAKRACYLAYGTFVHKACGHHNFDARVAWKEVEHKYNGQSQGSAPQQNQEPESLRCPAEYKQKFSQQIADKLKTSDDEQKITMIKTLGNMGLKETLDELEEVAEDDNTAVYIRTQAIYAMRHIAPDYTQEVAEILLPLYRETNTPTQVRIAAFVILLAGQPDLPILEDITQSLNDEPDVDVASYVYTSLTTLANSTDPCLKNVTRDIRLALEFSKPVNAGWRHSRGIHMGQYAISKKSGVFWEFNRIMDKDAPFMRAANLRVSANVMHKSFDIFEATFETEGWGDSLRKYIGNFSTEALADVLTGKAPRRFPRDTTNNVPVPEDLSEINQLLNIVPKEHKELRGTASIKFLGQETRFVVINPQTISKFIVELMTQSTEVIPKLFGEGLNIDNRRALLLINTAVEFPTILGVPISSSIKLPIFGGFKGNMKVNMEPTPEPGFGMFKQIPKKVTVEVDMETKIAAELHTKLSVYLGFFKIASGIRTKFNIDLPMDGKVELDVQSKMSKFTMDMPENPISLVKIESYPVTYVMKMSRNEKTFQPKPVSQSPQLKVQEVENDETSGAEPHVNIRQPPQQDQKYMHLEIDTVDTEMVTDNGHVTFKKFAGLPMVFPEVYEVSTPDFYKSRDINFTIGHETMAAEINVQSTMEYPGTELPGYFLPSLTAKNEFEIKVTPKKGLRKVTVTAYERSVLSVQTEKEILAKLQDKVQGITVKDLVKPNTPKDYETFPKLGHSLQILVNSEGSEAADAWTTRGLLSLIYTVDGRYVKTYAAMESKVPVLADKICFAGEMRHPDRTGMWFLTPEESLKNKSVQGNMEAYWGDDCTTEKMIKLRLRLQKTEEQKDVEKHDLYDENGVPVPEEVAYEVTEGENLFTSMYKECQEDRQKGAYFSKPCTDFATYYTELLKLKIDVEYKNVPKSIRKALSKFASMTKARYFWNTDVEDVDVVNPANKLSAVCEISADRKMIDVKYQTPNQNVNITNIELPFNIQPISALYPWSPARLAGLYQFPTCTLSGPKINSFDDLDDEQPLSGSCWHVLAKDNSPENLFAVLVANVQPNSVAKKVAVLFKGHKIEIVPQAAVPTGDASQRVGISNYIVKYNGQELTLTAEKRMAIPPNTPADKQEVANVMLVKPESSGNKENENIFAIHSSATGLLVFFDGSSVTVLPSPWWKGGVVGLCGTYNGQLWDEFLLPNNKYAESAEEYSHFFMIQKPGCDATIPGYQPTTAN